MAGQRPVLVAMLQWITPSEPTQLSPVGEGHDHAEEAADGDEDGVQGLVEGGAGAGVGEQRVEELEEEDRPGRKWLQEGSASAEQLVFSTTTSHVGGCSRVLG